MSGDTKVFVYFGPLSWFDEKVGTKKRKEGLLEAVFARDERLRQFRVVTPGQDGEVDAGVPQQRRPKRLVAESGDYASLQEHVITNFPGLVQSLNPTKLYLHNPPEHVHEHLKRIYADTFKVSRYEYPVVTREILAQFNNEFSQHLIGQAKVRVSMSAALYPLTRQKHSKPVVVMFYGPSGVGKTETAQFINRLLGGKLMRKQFSMFHNERFASYLFGGGHSEPSFAHDLLDRESGVVLIDEFDKAASVFHSAFYQFFDGGIFQDKNYRVDVGRSLIICTSNYGSADEIRLALGDALYSRFDALIPFEILSQDDRLTVADRLVTSRFESLEDDERDLIDIARVKDVVQRIASQSSNVRTLGKKTDEVFSRLLVDALLARDVPEGPVDLKGHAAAGVEDLDSRGA